MTSVSAPSTPPPHPNHQIHTIRSLTGADVFSSSPCPSPTNPEKRYCRQNILLFRSATGEERPLCTSIHQPDEKQLLPKPRISSVTDSSQASPSPSHDDLHQVPFRTSLPDVEAIPLAPVYEDQDDCDSIYSHASVINLDDLDEEDIASLRLNGLNLQEDAPAVISRKLLDIRRQSFANSFAKVRQAKTRRALVLARPEMQPHNRSICLMERCVRALTEALDLNLLYADIAIDKFNSFSSLFTSEERQVIADLLKEASARLRIEAPTPWRSPLRTAKRFVVRAHIPHSHSANQISNLFRSPWGKRHTKAVSSDTMVRSVVFGLHVIPGVQSAESILLRMAGEYQRDEVNRKASRAERIDIPLSFALTLTAALATFSRLECNVSYRRYRCRRASNRRSSPHAVITVKTKYDGLRLSFAVTLHGESPCTVLFRRPGIFSLRKIDDYAGLVTEAKDILSEFGREVTGNRNAYCL